MSINQPPVSDGDDFDILDWIESGTVARRKVNIYNDAALAEESDELQRQLDALPGEEDDTESSIGEMSERTRIERAMADVYERWLQSKAVWTVRALADEEIDTITAELPVPEQPAAPARPERLQRSASRQERERHDRDERAYEDERDAYTRGPLAAWAKQVDAVQEQRVLRYIAEAVVEVETARGSTSTVSVDALARMRKAPHGKARIGKIYAAVEAITTGDTEIPVPKSLTSSEPDQV